MKHDILKILNKVTLIIERSNKVERANTKLIKKMNKNLVRNCFKNEIDSTAANLSKKTGLSVVTVNGILKEMVNSKEIFLGKSIPSNGGRPSIVYQYNTMYRCSVIILGFTRKNINYIKVLVTNLLGNCIYSEENKFENINDNSFDKILDTLFKKYPTIEVISFGLPGVEVNDVITINDYPNIVGDTFLKHYKDRYKVPVIFINDINAAVNGYYHNKLDDNYDQTIVGLVFNKIHLPGSGIVINGDIHIGKSNFTGEFAYMPIGIDWLKINYDDIEETSEAIGKVIAIMSCIIAPEHFVIYGDFFKSDSVIKIKEKAEKMLQNQFEINLIISNDFEEDYELGMIKASLEILNKNENMININKYKEYE